MPDDRLVIPGWELAGGRRHGRMYVNADDLARYFRHVAAPAVRACPPDLSITTEDLAVLLEHFASGLEAFGRTPR